VLDRREFYRLERLDPLTEDFRALAEESRREGFWMLVRLLDGWESGRNRFSRRGETVLAAWRGDGLAGVCGLNVDPYVDRPRQGRIRHLYVSPAHRGNRVGRLLVEAVIDKARRHFRILRLRAPETAFGFYEALGFERIEGEEHVTHRLRLTKPAAGG